MEKIINQEFGGERPLYCKHDLYLENVKIHAGESALKETGNITAVHCQFEGKYPFWGWRGSSIAVRLLLGWPILGFSLNSGNPVHPLNVSQFETNFDNAHLSPGVVVIRR